MIIQLEIIYIYSLDDLINAYSGDYERNYTDYQNVFLYQNIKYVDENGTVLSTEDLNMIFSLLSMEIGVPYSAIKYHYETYGVDGILMLLNVNMDDPDEVDQVRSDVEDYMNELNLIIDDIVIGEIGIDIWKTVVVPSNSTIPDNTTNPGNSTNPDNTTNPGNSTIVNVLCDCGLCNNTGNNSNNQTIPKIVEKPPVKKVDKKVDLAIVSIKKIKSPNKKNPKYKIIIINKGNIKSKTTILSIFHKKNGIKIKTKNFKVKSIGAGKKISIIVDYYPDRNKHRDCKVFYTLDPKNKNKETILANNKKTISLKY